MVAVGVADVARVVVAGVVAAAAAVAAAALSAVAVPLDYAYDRRYPCSNQDCEETGKPHELRIWLAKLWRLTEHQL